MITEDKVVTDRIESFKIDKAKKTMLFCGIAIVFILIIKFLMGSSTQIASIGWWLDILVLVAIPLYLLVKTQKQFSNRAGQFIEWKNDAIIYKLKNEVSPQTIQRRQIDTINLHLETIEVINISNDKFHLDISDFDKYEDRLKIKNNFEREKNCP